MEQTIFLVLGGFSIAWSVAAFMLTLDEPTEIMFKLLAVVFWAFWAVSAGRVEITTSCCVQVTSYPELSILGGLVGLVYFVGVVWHVIELLGR